MKFLNFGSFPFIICLLCAIALMINYNPNSSLYTNIEARIFDLTQPIMSSSSVVLHSLEDISSNINAFFTVFAENKQLKERNDFLEPYFYLYKQTEAENKQLKEDLHFSKNISYNYITAEVIGRTNHTLTQQIIIDSGAKQGIAKWQVVLFHDQLVGRVVQVHHNTAKILLLTDPTSSIPVTTINSKIKFIATGQSTNYLICKYLNEQHSLQEGELVVTNGDNELITPNVIIGSIFKEDNIFYIKPIIDFDKLQFVQILQFNQHE